MEVLKQQILKSNQAIQSSGIDTEDYDYYALVTSEPASDSDIAELESMANITLPAELLTFYKTLGSITNEASDYSTIRVLSVATLLKKLSKTNHFQGLQYADLKSMGLIDFISFVWGGEIYDYFEKEDSDYFNENYKCFGYVLTSIDNGYANYLYFDKNNKFGYVHYDQERFDDFWDEHLTEMRTKSPAKNSFEELIISEMDKLVTKLIDDKNWE